MLPGCWAPCPDNAPMTDSLPPPPVLRRIESEVDLFTKLSEFQAAACARPPIRPSLPAVLAAAMPALQKGFSYSASHWGGELTVTVHYQNAELGSSAPATPTSYSDVCARLLAGLLGIPLLDGDQAAEPEPLEPASAACGLKPPETDLVEPDPAPGACGLRPVPDPVEPEEADEFEACPAPSPAADISRALTEEEKAAAIAMIKAMAPEQRKAFTRAFRETFEVPPEAKQVAPYITELRHLHFIDRVTVEAAGGIAA